jgi:hypothetical protein
VGLALSLPRIRPPVHSFPASCRTITARSRQPLCTPDNRSGSRRLGLPLHVSRLCTSASHSSHKGTAAQGGGGKKMVAGWYRGIDRSGEIFLQKGTSPGARNLFLSGSPCGWAHSRYSCVCFAGKVREGCLFLGFPCPSLCFLRNR